MSVTKNVCILTRLLAGNSSRSIHFRLNIKSANRHPIQLLVPPEKVVLYGPQSIVQAVDVEVCYAQVTINSDAGGAIRKTANLLFLLEKARCFLCFPTDQARKAWKATGGFPDAPIQALRSFRTTILVGTRRRPVPTSPCSC